MKKEKALQDTSSKLTALEDCFKEWSIRLDQSHKDGRTIMSTRSASNLCKDISKLIRVIREDV